MRPVAPPAGGRPGSAAAIFLAFASAYLLSTLLRAVTATLAPVFSAELGLGSADLGLLAGAYFLGFSLTQLPLGTALDRFGPKRVLCGLLVVAVVACLGYARAQGLAQMLAARVLIGIGVSACLMAPLTCYRHRFSPTAQVRANSWMLMTGSLGMLVSTVPVQALLPVLGWRGLFVGVAGLLALALLTILVVVPGDPPVTPSQPGAQGYRQVFGHPDFIRTAPLGFVVYGGLLAMQSLWIGPWLTQVSAQTPAQAAQGLLGVNGSMLLAFLTWGVLMPRVLARGWPPLLIVTRAGPAGVLIMAWIAWLGPQATAAHWALWCVSTSVVSLSQPALAQAFSPSLAGRALSAFNLVIFAGVFAMQWIIGLSLDACRAAGLPAVPAYQVTFAGFAAASALCYAWMIWRPAHAGEPVSPG